jgi:hypothetical protein
LEFKGVRRLKSNTSGLNANPRFGRRRRHGVAICGRTSNIQKETKEREVSEEGV